MTHFNSIFSSPFVLMWMRFKVRNRSIIYLCIWEIDHLISLGFCSLCSDYIPYCFKNNALTWYEQAAPCWMQSSP